MSLLGASCALQAFFITGTDQAKNGKHLTLHVESHGIRTVGENRMQTLDEARAELEELETADKAAEKSTEPDDTDEIQDIVDVEDKVDEEEPELDEDGKPIEKKEPEPWMETVAEELEDGKVPVDTHIRVKQKLKGRIKEKDDEAEVLKARIAELEGRTKIAPETEIPKRPREDAFETDEEYHSALDEYEENRTRSRYAAIERDNAIRKTQEKHAKTLEKKVDEHYERADELVKKSGISPEIYQKADKDFRGLMESIRPDYGDILTDNLISVLGKGSEKVLFFVSRNETARNKIISLFADDPSGLEVAAYLGEERGRLNNDKPNKKISQARKPTANIKGDAVIKSSAKALKKEFDKADRDGDAQGMWDAKKAAKEAKVDVSGW